ncbi:MAG TPA: hypothetical protein VNF24_04610 [Candidatus Acidoferrales bacterium]|nr:hypothetical protein [Candidatus Acidoferrales bacterium]
MAEQIREFVADGTLPVMEIGVADPQASIATNASPAPGSGTTTVSIETAVPRLPATTPRTSKLIFASP